MSYCSRTAASGRTLATNALTVGWRVLPLERRRSHTIRSQQGLRRFMNMSDKLRNRLTRSTVRLAVQSEISFQFDVDCK